MRGARSGHGAGLCGLAIVCACLFCASAMAQTGPFGVGVPEQSMGASGTGILGYIAARQSEFYRALTGALRALREDGHAAWMLAGLSLLYGVFHAAGPGHGKAVLTSYILANEASWKRGVVLSFASAALQATTAVVLVAVLALVFRATSIGMTNAAWWLEVVSYALVTALGLWLLATKSGLPAVLARLRPRPASLGAAAALPAHGEDCACCGHAHMPDGRVVGRLSTREAVSTVFAIGLRPCTGAIIVLVFALAQGLFPAGIASAYVMGFGTAVTVATIAAIAVFAKGWAVRLLGAGGRGARVAKAIEIGGAGLVFLFGLVLLLGALA